MRQQSFERRSKPHLYKENGQWLMAWWPGCVKHSRLADAKFAIKWKNDTGSWPAKIPPAPGRLLFYDELSIILKKWTTK